MNYKDFNLGDWIGHISGVIEDESELDGNEMRDLVEFLTTLEQEPIDNVLNKITGELKTVKEKWWYGVDNDCFIKLSDVLQIIDKYRKEQTGV